VRWLGGFGVRPTYNMSKKDLKKKEREEEGQKTKQKKNNTQRMITLSHT
jgi:hypothetical protein